MIPNQSSNLFQTYDVGIHDRDRMSYPLFLCTDLSELGEVWPLVHVPLE